MVATVPTWSSVLLGILWENVGSVEHPGLGKLVVYPSLPFLVARIASGGTNCLVASATAQCLAQKAPEGRLEATGAYRNHPCNCWSCKSLQGRLRGMSGCISCLLLHNKLLHIWELKGIHIHDSSVSVCQESSAPKDLPRLQSRVGQAIFSFGDWLENNLPLISFRWGTEFISL